MSILGHTVLIIDDSVVDRQLYQRYFLADPDRTYHFLEAESVAAGLKLCRSQTIDVILLDYLLPEADGLDFLTALKTEGNTTAPPVVMVTGRGDESIAAKAIKLGAADYLVKSNFTPERLQLTLSNAIASASLRRELAKPNELDDGFATAWCDVTIQKQMEEERNRFFDLSIDLLSIANFEGYFVRLNPAWEATLGFTTAEIMAQPYVDLLHPDDLAATLSAAQELKQGNVVVQFENRYRCKDGSYRWLSWSSRPYNDQNNDQSLVYAVAHDITDRKHNETRLRQSEELTRRVLESSSDCIKVMDLEGRLIYMNNHGQSLMEIDDFDTVNRSQWLEFWQGRSVERELAQTAFVTALAGGVKRFDGYCATAKGTPKWWEVVVTPILDADNDVYQILSISRDITDRKSQEAALRQSERKFSAIFNQTFQLMGLVSLDGILLDVNQAALDSIGVTESSIVGKNFWDTPWWHTDQLQQQLQAAIVTAASGEFVRYEVQFPNANGAVVVTDFSLKPLFDEVGSVEAIVAEANDITDRKEAQAKLEQRNRELDSFVHIVSHDLKAPLRAVANLSHWIEDDLEGSLTPETQTQMTLLRRRVDQMAATIDGLLDYARIGRTPDTISVVSVAELLDQTIESLGPPATFEIIISPPLPILQTNHLLLSQVFANLIGNSIKHHDRPNGKIYISCQEHDDLYQFIVADDGPGIAPKNHDKIFTIFQAVNPQNSPDSTGVGLSIVKKIIETVGGTIHLESTIGEGATFYFTWPK